MRKEKPQSVTNDVGRFLKASALSVTDDVGANDAVEVLASGDRETNVARVLVKNEGLQTVYMCNPAYPVTENGEPVDPDEWYIPFDPLDGMVAVCADGETSTLRVCQHEER